MKTNPSNTNKFCYLQGLANFIVVVLIVWLFYRLFLHPQPIFKTSMEIFYNALSFVAVFLSSIVMIVFLIGFYPPTIERMPLIFRGILLLFLSILLTAGIYFIIFRLTIGKFAVAYFSPASIIASGGTGAEPLNALIQSSRAIFYFHLGFLYVAFLWKLGAGDWPWNNCKKHVVASSRIITVLLLSILTYTILFHPDICYLFYPPQNKAGVEPWWSNFSGTGSGLFHVGWILCALAWIIISMFLWEGYPWKFIYKDENGSIARVAATFIGTLGLGVIAMIILMKVMNLIWGEAFPGGQYTDGIDFRYIRAGEICSFFILVAFILKSHFNNFPNNLSIWGRVSIRTTITIIGGLIFYFFYYSRVGEFFLEFETGTGFPYDTPLTLIMLFLSIVLIHDVFFQGWPIRNKGLKEKISKEK
ncbi:MAG: hypothetical protein MIO92_05680 [Methanosarcinaceae archaeon]|nr:hypothetical protein [Methanosarcinaceae archaeon]